jgi:1-pyrroline-4-hydroxy-2-carboxylate deaminase
LLVLVNAFPKESVALFNYVSEGNFEKAYKLYHWFLPLLRLDTVIKFVQMIKLVQADVKMGTSVCARTTPRTRWQGVGRNAGSY